MYKYISCIIFILFAINSINANLESCTNPWINSGTDDINLLVFGNFVSCESDTEGRVANSGDVALQSYSIGAALSPNDNDFGYCLTSAGNVTWNGGSCYQGELTTAALGDINEVAVINQGQVYYSNECCTDSNCQSCNEDASESTPLDFDSAENCAISVSSYYASLSTSNSAQILKPSANELQLICTNRDPENIFSLTADDLSAVTSISIICSTTQTVLINYPPSYLSLNALGYQLENGVSKAHILHHFPYNPSTETNNFLHIGAVGVPGSVFAPERHLFFQQGVIEGQVVAQEFSSPDNYYTPGVAYADSCGGNGGHAVWLPGIATKLAFESSSLPKLVISVDSQSAVITGTVTQGAVSFDVLVNLSGYVPSGVTPPSGSPKLELKNSCYTSNGGNIDPSEWFYYTNIHGNLTATPGSFYEGAILDITRMGPSAQYGYGANGKNQNLGFSFWFYYTIVQEGFYNSVQGTGRGDFNLDLFGQLSTDDQLCPRGQVNHLPFTGCLSTPTCS